jgi:peptide/nickel transport system ATP-binding protein
VPSLGPRAPLLEVRHLCKRYAEGGLFGSRQVRALEDASFVIRRGEIVALVGQSGSGKSTLARLLARLTAPSAGAILLDGRNVLEDEPRRASREYRRRVQMIFQDPFASLNPVRTVAHHVARPLRIHGHARTAHAARERTHELLRDVGLEPAAAFAPRLPHELSGGQRQRVAIARALAAEPQLLLADEPVSMLDVSVRVGILNLIGRLKAERGIACLYITHDLASARYVADRVLVLYAGRIVEEGAAEELTSHPAHPYTRLLLAAVPDPRRPETAWAAPRPADAATAAAASVPPSAGCPFARACPDVLEHCHRRMPEPIEVAAGHRVRCHLYDGQTARPE